MKTDDELLPRRAVIGFGARTNHFFPDIDEGCVKRQPHNVPKICT